MCICVYAGFLSNLFFFVVNFPSLYEFLFFLRRSTERNRERKIEQTKWRESERIIDDFSFFRSFLLSYCSLYGIFFIFISFSEFRFFCPSNYIMFFFYFIFFWIHDWLPGDPVLNLNLVAPDRTLITTDLYWIMNSMLCHNYSLFCSTTCPYYCCCWCCSVDDDVDCWWCYFEPPK